MAMTFTRPDDLKYPFAVGSHYEQHVYLIPDSSYPTGGYVYSSSTVNGLTLGLDIKTIFAVIPIGGDTDAVGYELYQNFETGKMMILLSSAGFTPAGTIAAHTHVLHFQTSAAANAVTAAANQLRTAAAAFDVAGVANSSGEGGIVNATTVFTGTPQASGPAVEVTNGTNLSALRFFVRIVGR